MAVSGSGGWKPSRKCRLRNGKLVFSGYAQNKPRSVVYEDMAEAAAALRQGKRIELHYYADNVPQLQRLLGGDND